MALGKCRKCRAKLVEGPVVARREESKKFSVVISGIPTNVCPNGCPGQYWYWLDFGVEVITAVRPNSPNVARRKWIFLNRQYCKTCGLELVDHHSVGQFPFVAKLHNGQEVSMDISAPALDCTSCNRSFMPAQTSSIDSYYGELADVIGAAITRDLIYK